MREPSAAGPRLRYLRADDAAGKRDILTAALHLFVRDGLCETTIRDIAKSAGYSNPVLFKHFDSKDHLARHLFEQCYLGLFADIDRALAGESGFRAELRALIESYLRALDEDRDAVLFVQDNLRHFWPRVAPHVRASSIVGRVHALLERGRSANRSPTVCRSICLRSGGSAPFSRSGGRGPSAISQARRLAIGSSSKSCSCGWPRR